MGSPGAGKSQFWNNLVQRMGVPTLYWSADTDQADVTARTLALWLGLETTQVESYLQEDRWRTDMFDRLGDKAGHIEWVFDPDITGKGLGERLDAFAEVNGIYPFVTVLDNLSNAVDASDEYAGTKGTMKAAQKLGRETRSHIAFLHHSTGEYEDGLKPISQGGAIQKAFKTVELGLTMHRPDREHLGLNVVKNRGGISDPGAKHTIYLPIDFSRATVHGYDKQE